MLCRKQSKKARRSKLNSLHTGVMYLLNIANAFLLLACIGFRGTAHANQYGSVPSGVGLHPFRLEGRAARTEYILWLVLLSGAASPGR